MAGCSGGVLFGVLFGVLLVLVQVLSGVCAGVMFAVEPSPGILIPYEFLTSLASQKRCQFQFSGQTGLVPTCREPTVTHAAFTIDVCSCLIDMQPMKQNLSDLHAPGILF